MNQEESSRHIWELSFSFKTEINKQNTDNDNQGPAQNMGAVCRDIKIIPDRNIPGCYYDEQPADNRDNSLKIAHRTLPVLFE